MIKKVRVEYLVPWVYIEDFNCDWKGSNLYVEPGLIKNDNIIEILKSWGIDEVYIDIEKGLDVGVRRKPTVVADPDGEVAQIYKQVARTVAVKIAQQAKDFSSKFPTIKVSQDT